MRLNALIELLREARISGLRGGNLMESAKGAKWNSLGQRPR
jgi:hypothetical protein